MKKLLAIVVLGLLTSCADTQGGRCNLLGGACTETIGNEHFVEVTYGTSIEYSLRYATAHCRQYNKTPKFDKKENDDGQYASYLFECK